MEIREYETGTKLPSVDPLSRIILYWDFHHDIFDDRKADVETEKDLLQRSIRATTANRLEQKILLEPLPTRFKDEEDYISRFMALLLIETKQQIQRAKEMEISEPEIVVQMGAEPVGSFIHVSLMRAEHTAATYFTTDLCVLYLDPPEEIEIVQEEEETAQPTDRGRKPLPWTNGLPPLSDSMVNTALSPLHPNPFNILCIVESSIRNTVVVKLLIPPVNRTDSRQVERITGIARALNSTGQRWYMARVMGMSTVNREYQALMSLPDLLLKDDVLLTGEDPIALVMRQIKQVEDMKKSLLEDDKKRPMPPMVKRAQLKKLTAMEIKRKKRLSQLRQRKAAESKPMLEIPMKLTQTLESLYNASQMDALRDCLKAEGVTLIQGPPGTGKTTTIVGVLSVILNAQLRPVKVSLNADDEASIDSTFKLSSRDFMQLAQPWLYEPDYKPWYDQVKLHSEDLETFVCEEADKTDALISLTRNASEGQPQKVLVCAPSNAAVDEIIRRLTRDPEKGGGVFNEYGERYNPPLVRMGPNVHNDLVAHSLNARASSRLQALGNATGAAKEAIKMKVLEEARVVCSTLSICGSREMVAFPGEFDTVVIDEASQGIEVSTLLSLRLGCRRLILVGDPKQLPATVFSRLALKNGYDTSLFQRLESAGHKVNMLSVQYRMHPAISAFPSEAFYDGNLLDAPNILSMVQPPVPWHEIPLFKPVTFLSLDTAHTAEASSLINMEEAYLACQLVELLQLMFHSLPEPDTNWMSRIAVISPYAEQVRLIRKQLKAHLQIDPNLPCPVDVNTVDGFQGREKDCVIFSAVRAEMMGNADMMEEADLKTNVGFLADVRRMNVALTRGRFNLWVLGNSQFLRGNPEWRKFIGNAEKTASLFHVNYEKFPKTGFIKRWLLSYLNRVSNHAELLAIHVPKFLDDLRREVASMA